MVLSARSLSPVSARAVPGVCRDLPSPRCGGTGGCKGPGQVLFWFSSSFLEYQKWQCISKDPAGFARWLQKFTDNFTSCWRCWAGGSSVPLPRITVHVCPFSLPIALFHHCKYMFVSEYIPFYPQSSQREVLGWWWKCPRALFLPSSAVTVGRCWVLLGAVLGQAPEPFLGFCSATGEDLGQGVSAKHCQL